MKEKFTNALGTFGTVLFYILAFAIAFIPFFILDFPWWAEILIIVAMVNLPIIGTIAELVLYVWGFTAAIKNPTDLFSIIFFVGLALFIFIGVIPVISSLFSKD